MRTHLKTIMLGALLCLGLVAAAKVLNVEIWVFDPDDQYFDSNIVLNVTAFDKAGHVIGGGDYTVEPSGPKPHVRLALPWETDHLSVDAYDFDDLCHQVFNNIDVSDRTRVGGRSFVGGQGITLVLSQCEGAVR